MKMSKPKVFIASSIAEKAVQFLSEEFDVVYLNVLSPTRNDILSKIQGVDAILWSVKEYLDLEVLNKAGPQLRVVSTASVGYDHINVQEIKKRGILFGNVATIPNKAVADIAILLTLAATRRLHEGWIKMNTGTWEFSFNEFLGQDIIGSTVGIVGLGSIGQAIVQRLQAFEVAEFIYSGHNKKPEGKDLGATFVSFDTLLRRSDVIIVACPYTSETHMMFNAEAFSKMKKTAVFVNVARGKIVDQDALIDALESNRIFAAGLDVMTPEPLPPGHKLYSLPNCVLIPHLGSATINTRLQMALTAAKNIKAALNNKPMLYPV